METQSINSWSIEEYERILLRGKFYAWGNSFCSKLRHKLHKKWIDRYQRTGVMNKLNDVKECLDTYVSVKTISRGLRENKYYACVARDKEFF